MFTLYIEATAVATYRALSDVMLARWYAIGFYGLRSTPAKVFVLPYR